jgi:transcriptional pleiotropic regulator of transition state genes
MKNTGIVRKLDELGRITLPIELRRTLDVTERDPLEIYTDEDTIVLKKYQGEVHRCAHCDETKDLKKLGKKYICKKCAADAFALVMED